MQDIEIEVTFKNKGITGEELKLIRVDKEVDIMAQYSRLNLEKKLQYAIVDIEGYEYFADVRLNEKEYNKHGLEYKCPCCGKPLAIFGGTNKMIRHFRHLKNSGECELKTQYAEKEIDIRKHRGNTGGESLEHKKLKRQVYLFFKKGAEFDIPCVKLQDGARIINKRTVTVIDAFLEKRALKKNNKTNGYIPDITLLTDTGEEIYLEITFKNGKTVDKYYDIWAELNNVVLEVRRREQELDKLNIKLLYSKELAMFRESNINKIKLESKKGQYCNFYTFKEGRVEVAETIF